MSFAEKNKEQMFGLIRHFMTIFGGYFVAQGMIDDSLLQTLIAAVIGVLGVIWSWNAPEKKLNN